MVIKMNNHENYKDKLISIQNDIIEKQSKEIFSLKARITEIEKKHFLSVLYCWYLNGKKNITSVIRFIKKIAKLFFSFFFNFKNHKIYPSIQFVPYSKNLVFSNKNLEYEKCLYTLNIAVLLHIVSIHLLPEIIEQLNYIPCSFDCYVSTDTEEKKNLISTELKKIKNINNISFLILKSTNSIFHSFFMNLSQIKNTYDLICNIHTELHFFNDNINIDCWRKYLFTHLLGSKSNISYILNHFYTSPDLGMVYPPDFPPVHAKIPTYITKLPLLMDILEHYSLPIEIDSIISEYPSGMMFWLRPSFLTKLLNDDYIITKEKQETTYNKDYEAFLYLSLKNSKFKIEKIYNNTLFRESTKKRLSFFVHYDKNNEISKSDFQYLSELKRISEELVFITVSKLKETDINKLKIQNITILRRANYGFDFGAWKDALNIYGFENLVNFDEIVFANNSCFAPIFNLESIFSEMEDRKVDFWGITSHCEVSDKLYNIPFHIQSYFLVFNRKVVLSEQFHKYWTEMPYFEDYQDAVNHGELRCTDYFSKDFSFDVYCNNLLNPIDSFNGYNYTLTEPEAVLLCGSPFIKKKVFQYASKEKQEDLVNIINKLPDISFLEELKKEVQF